jgi:titin
MPITGFTVEQTDGATTVVTELPGTARAFTAADLANSTAYRFRVRATNAMGAGEFSTYSEAVVPALPPLRTAPGPTDVTATAGDASAVVAWTPPTDDGGADITGYEVQAYDLVTFDPVGPARAVSEGTEVTMTGLTNGTPYWFRVRAVNPVGTGAWSDGSNPVTPMVPVTAPHAPAIRAATAGSGVAVVRWTAPADDGGAAITGYQVQVVNAATGATVGAVRRAAADAAQLTVTGLTNGTMYRFRVRAVNEIGSGTYSATSAAVKPMGTPGIPPSVTAARGAIGGPLTVTVRWTAPANGGSPIVAYHVTRQQLNARGHAVGTPVTATFSARNFSTTFTASRWVARDTRFRFIVQAVNEVGLGAGRSVIGSVR